MKIFLDTPKNIFAPNETVIIPVYLDTQNESVNAVDGMITFPSGMLQLQEIQDGNSIINFWVQQPTEAGDVISFSGITPGGFSGSRERVLTLIFQTKAAGAGNITAHMNVFRNDGIGTVIPVPETTTAFSVTGQSVATPLKTIQDKIPPENFQPIIGRDPNIFDGNYFIAFSTQDKGVGIDHYQIREGFLGKYKNTESPFVLRDQTLHTRITIKAFDRNGNSRNASVPVIWGAAHYIIVSLFGIIILGIITSLVSKKVWRKYIR